MSFASRSSEGSPLKEKQLYREAIKRLEIEAEKCIEHANYLFEFFSFPLTLTIQAFEVERKQKELDELKRQLEEEQAFYTSAVAQYHDVILTS